MLKLECPIPTEEVNIATRIVMRRKGCTQAQALGLTAAIKQRLMEACPNNLRGKRDRALLDVGYDTLCRRSELVMLKIENLSIDADGSGQVLVRQLKSIQYGEIRKAYLSVETMGHLQDWLRASGLDSGPIFRAIKCGAPTRDALNPYSVTAILKRLAAAAGLDRCVVEGLSSHSLRVGAAQDMAAAGIDLVAIMHAGGWRTPQKVMRYTEHMDVRYSGMARLHAKSGILGNHEPA